MVAKIEAGTKKVRPRGDRLLVKVEDAEARTKGGILLPDAAKERPQTAVVAAVGPGRVSDSGELIPLVGIKKGDVVILSRYSGTEVKIDDDAYLIVPADEILAVIEES
jgi:chaperonin GroES